jgi:uncharacterized protein (TIGR02118 family)
MYKVLILMRKKAGLSRAEFIDYYENKHVPLMRELAPGREVYRRNYIVFDDPMFNVDGRSGAADAVAFDVITESIFATREAAEAAKNAALASPANLKRVKGDEENFVEPGSVRMYVVEVRQSPIP